MDEIPTIGKLLQTDQRTLENCMALLNAARDNNRLDAAIWRELKLCVDNGMSPDFLPKIQEYMKKALGKSKKKNGGAVGRPKL